MIARLACRVLGHRPGVAFLTKGLVWYRGEACPRCLGVLWSEPIASRSSRRRDRFGR